MKIKIVSDSTCDLTKELIEKYNISVTPLVILKDDKEYYDGVDITPMDIFEYVDSGKGICHTSAINAQNYIDIFSQYTSDYDAVISFHISSDMSVCYANACTAAEELGNVYVIDSRNLSTGIGHLVLDAAIMAQEGKLSPQEIVDIINEEKAKLDVSFVIDTLKYLHKGGRCSGVAALGANLLKLKPCIEVTEGKMDVGKKYRGNFANVIIQYVRDRLSDLEAIDPRRIFITYAPGTPDSVVQAVKDEVTKLNYFEEILTSTAGCSVSNHCGPVCLGVLFFRK